MIMSNFTAILNIASGHIVSDSLFIIYLEPHFDTLKLGLLASCITQKEDG